MGSKNLKLDKIFNICSICIKEHTVYVLIKFDITKKAVISFKNLLTYFDQI